MEAGDSEGRDTPKSEGRREEDENCFGPIGREGKKVLGKMLVEKDDWLGGIERVGCRGRMRVRRGGEMRGHERTADATPWRKVSRCPYAVAKERGGNFRTRVRVKSGIPWM